MYDLLKKKLSDEEVPQEFEMNEDYVSAPATEPVPVAEPIQAEEAPVPQSPAPQAPLTSPVEESEDDVVDFTKNNELSNSSNPSAPNQDEDPLKTLMYKSVNERPQINYELKNPYDNVRYENLLKEYETLSGKFKEPDSMLGENLHGLSSTLAAASGNDALAANQSGKQKALRDLRTDKLDRYQKIMESMAGLESKKQDAQNEIEKLRYKAVTDRYLSPADMVKLRNEENKLNSLERRAKDTIISRETVNDTKIESLSKRLDDKEAKDLAKAQIIDKKDSDELEQFQLAEYQLNEIDKLMKSGDIDPGPVSNLVPKMLQSKKTTQVRQLLEKRLADFMKAISGASVPESEVQRLKSTLPTYEDNDDEFVTKLEGAITFAKDLKNRRIASLEGRGKKVPENFYQYGGDIDYSNRTSPSQSTFSPQQERGIERVVNANKSSREEAINALKAAGKL